MDGVSEPQEKGRTRCSSDVLGFSFRPEFLRLQRAPPRTPRSSQRGGGAGICWGWGQAIVRIRKPLSPCRGSPGWAEKGARGRQRRERWLEEEAGACGPRGRVRKRGAGYARAAPLQRGLRGRPRACGCERGGRSQLRLARSPAGRRPGDQEGRGRRCRKPASAGGGLQDEEGLCPFALLPPARPPASTAPPRELSRTGPGPSLPAARLTRGPGNGVANSQGRARSGRKLEPREQRPRSVAQPEKLAAAAPFGPASPDLLLQGLKKREPR